ASAAGSRGWTPARTSRCWRRASTCGCWRTGRACGSRASRRSRCGWASSTRTPASPSGNGRRSPATAGTSWTWPRRSRGRSRSRAREGDVRVLVTGGAGFIGSHYVRSLLSGAYPAYADAEVVVLDLLTYAGTLTNLAECEGRSEEHTSELQSRENLVCRLLLE